MPDRQRPLINEVRNRLGLLFPEPDLGWTEAVNIALCEACEKCDPQCQFYGSGVRLVEEEGGLASGGEWLFDATCLQYDSDGYLRRVPLAAESEWSRRADDIFHDVEKLLVDCADARAMVFDGTIWPGNDNKFDEFRFSAYITKSEHAVARDTYLLLITYQAPPRHGHDGRSVSNSRWRGQIDGRSSRKVVAQPPEPLPMQSGDRKSNFIRCQVQMPAV